MGNTISDVVWESIRLNLAKFILLSLLICLQKQASLFRMLPNHLAEQFPIITTTGTTVFDLVPYFVLIERFEKISF